MSDNWMQSTLAQPWMPTFDLIEAHYNIPQHLLARIGYQESSFRPEVISGQVQSSAGAVGIMQLMRRYFPSAGIDPQADIDTAGKLISQLYARFKDWQLAVAAYNWGQGNVNHEMSEHGDLSDMPKETQNYVKQIFADIGVPGVLVHNV